MRYKREFEPRELTSGYRRPWIILNINPMATGVASALLLLDNSRISDEVDLAVQTVTSGLYFPRRRGVSVTHSIRYPIRSEEMDNPPVTTLGLPVSISDGDFGVSLEGGSNLRVRRAGYIQGLARTGSNSI
ncbi:hypothetical protein EVAR_96925_1 [Eumeta japonica]|uniref:Uncharacterized protein n=1 Tax=Eumeta variegata TaxID=151549 RepID=A0A4C2A9Z4_EUMVA|nr:hypothetical protein EVAR_96925_1 [Eumeta japonica]